MDALSKTLMPDSPILGPAPNSKEGPLESTQGHSDEDWTLEAIVYDENETPRRIYSRFNIICAAYNILQAWAAIGATFALGISHGGSAAIIYGLILIFLIYIIIALSMAELAAKYPTAGGEYHWTAMIAPVKVRRELSYACGSINTIGWVTLTASVLIIPPQIIVGIIKFYDSSYTMQRWHVFVLYQALNLLSLLYNIFALQRAPWTHDVGFVLSVGSFLAITVTCLVIAHPKQSSHFVFSDFINETGWTAPGIAFLTGISNPNYGFAGLDSAVHLAEECLNAASAVPWAMISAVITSFITAMIFMIVTLYSIQDFDTVLSTDTGVPLYEIFHQAIRSPTAATTFILLLALIILFTIIAAQQGSSRLTWAFARDDGLIFSKYIKTLHPRFHAPVWALVFNATCVFLLGCVYLASSTAFNAIVAPGLILEQISFAIPAALLMWQGRPPQHLPANGPFKLGKFGWVANGVTVGWAGFEIVFYNLPAERPVTSGNMNYTCAVLGAIAIFILANWHIHGKAHFRGPKLNLERRT